MKLGVKFYVWFLLSIIFGVLLLYVKMILKSEIPIYVLVSFVLLVAHYPVTECCRRMRINKLKKDLKIQGNFKLEELERKRIEQEYRDLIERPKKDKIRP
jgi:hypothetical protein